LNPTDKCNACALSACAMAEMAAFVSMTCTIRVRRVLSSSCTIGAQGKKMEVPPARQSFVQTGLDAVFRPHLPRAAATPAKTDFR